MTNNPIAEAVFKRDRMIVTIGLSAVVFVAALYTINTAQSYDRVLDLILSICVGGNQTWTYTDLMNNPMFEHTGHIHNGFLSLFGMWTVMQVAMMSPTAVPMILMHVKVQRSRHPAKTPYLQTVLFFLGYIIIWTGFSAAIARIQLYLQSTSLLTPQMAFVSPWLAGGSLIAAGLFQFSKLKEVCLNGCRSPVTYFMTEWREGDFGALMMGLKHGLHCMGCCWVLMALLFVAGVMNLLWMAVITVFVLLEKVFPSGKTFGQIGGAVMIVWGVVLMIL